MGGLEDDASHRRGTDPAREKDRGDGRLRPQRKCAVRRIQLDVCSVGQVFEYPLKCRIT
jgi:hypothetical protein